MTLTMICVLLAAIALAAALVMSTQSPRTRHVRPTPPVVRSR
ncbi:MAG: hypothetical protein ACYDHT_07265 [Solirubrobacteraceae bacterium]